MNPTAATPVQPRRGGRYVTVFVLGALAAALAFWLWPRGDADEEAPRRPPHPFSAVVAPPRVGAGDGGAATRPDGVQDGGAPLSDADFAALDSGAHPSRQRTNPLEERWRDALPAGDANRVLPSVGFDGGATLSVSFVRDGFAPATARGVSIRGRVRWAGETPQPISVTSDNVDCGQTLPQQGLKLKGDTLADVIVSLSKISVVSADSDGAGVPPLGHVTSQHCQYEPYVQLAAAGPLTLNNKDNLIRDVGGFDGSRETFVRQLPARGGTLMIENAINSGDLELRDAAFPWARAWIFLASPLVRQTGADGLFEFGHVKARTNHVFVTVEHKNPDRRLKMEVEASEAGTIYLDITLR